MRWAAGKGHAVKQKKAMERLDLKIIKKKVVEMQKQSAADLEAVTNMAKLRYDYQASQLDNLLRLCEHSLILQEPKLEPKGLEPKGA